MRMQNHFNYPTSPKVPVEHDYFGKKIADPYNWLEEENTPPVTRWIEEQNKATHTYLEQISYKNKILERLKELVDYPKMSTPIVIGNYLLYTRNSGLQNQAVYYTQSQRTGKEKLFLDPNTLSKDGTVAVSYAGSSKDKRKVTFSVNRSGSDWAEFWTYDLVTGEKYNDLVERVKFSGASWDRQGGFYYSRFPEPKEGKNHSQSNRYHAVWYHKFGTPQSQDLLIYEDRENSHHYHSAHVSHDGLWVFLYANNGTGGNRIFYRSAANQVGEWIPVVGDFEYENDIIGSIGKKVYMVTNHGADNGRVVRFMVDGKPLPEWQEVVAEEPSRLDNASVVGGKLLLQYLVDASHRIYVANADGRQKREIPLEGIGSVSEWGGKETDPVVYFSFSSYNIPKRVFKFDVFTEESSLFWQPETKFEMDSYQVTQQWYESTDGTKVPVFLVAQKGLAKDGKRPLYLYGYGGFNISIVPRFSASTLILLEQGGVLAIPNLRGGGEFGRKWHQGGMLMNKKQVFEDFIACAEYLHREGYSAPRYTAIAGGSNGGLLVGACMTMRPDLFAVAFPTVGVLDMLRFHRFTVGKGWVPEYGCAEDSIAAFEYLLSYSPLHNLKQDVEYPATLVMTGDHDDRVVPSHSFKFTARLQETDRGNTPAFIRVEMNTGHGAGKPLEKILREIADRWAFFFYSIGVKELQ